MSDKDITASAEQEEGASSSPFGDLNDTCSSLDAYLPDGDEAGEDVTSETMTACLTDLQAWKEGRARSKEASAGAESLLLRAPDSSLHRSEPWDAVLDGGPASIPAGELAEVMERSAAARESLQRALLIKPGVADVMGSIPPVPRGLESEAAMRKSSLELQAKLLARQKLMELGLYEDWLEEQAEERQRQQEQEAELGGGAGAAAGGLAVAGSGLAAVRAGARAVAGLAAAPSAGGVVAAAGESALAAAASVSASGGLAGDAREGEEK